MRKAERAQFFWGELHRVRAKQGGLQYLRVIRRLVANVTKMTCICSCVVINRMQLVKIIMAVWLHCLEETTSTRRCRPLPAVDDQPQ